MGESQGRMGTDRIGQGRKGNRIAWDRGRTRKDVTAARQDRARHRQTEQNGTEVGQGKIRQR